MFGKFTPRAPTNSIGQAPKKATSLYTKLLISYAINKRNWFLLLGQGGKTPSGKVPASEYYCNSCFELGPLSETLYPTSKTWFQHRCKESTKHNLTYQTIYFHGGDLVSSCCDCPGPSGIAGHSISVYTKVLPTKTDAHPLKQRGNIKWMLHVPNFGTF